MLGGVRAACEDPRRPRHQTRGQPRPSGKRRQAVLSGSIGVAGAVQPWPDPWSDGPPARWRIQGNHLGRGHRHARPEAAGRHRQARRVEWRRPGHLYRSPTGLDRGPGRQAGPVPAVQLRAPPRRQSAGLRHPGTPRLRLLPGQVHPLLRRRLPGQRLAFVSGTPAGLRGVARIQRGRDGQTRDVRAAHVAHRHERRRVALSASRH